MNQASQQLYVKVLMLILQRDKLKHCQVVGMSKHSTLRETNENIAPVRDIGSSSLHAKLVKEESTLLLKFVCVLMGMGL